MRTYRELFGVPEFTPFFLTSAGIVAGQTVTGLALGTLILRSTGSPLLSALAMFGPMLAQALGATTLLSAADRLAPRAALVGLAVLFAAAATAQAIPGLPVPAAFAVLVVMGMLASLGGGIRYGLLNEILAGDGYVLGRSVINISVGLMQIGGFATGGVLVTVLSPRGTLLVGAALYLAAAALARFGLSARQPRATGRPSIRETWRDNALLWSARPRRYVFLASCLPNGLVVGCESLFVPYAPRHAGLLLAFGALGMLTGDVLLGRFVPRRWRTRLVVPLLLLLAAPFLIFVLRPPLPLAVAAVTLATVGYAANLTLQERLMALTPERLAGHALGLHSSGKLTMQGVGAALAGTVAEITTPATAMTVLAAMSLAVTLPLSRGLRESPGPARQPAPHPAA